MAYIPPPKPSPTLRKEAWDDVHNTLRDAFKRHDVFRSCITCTHWTHEGRPAITTTGVPHPMGAEPPEHCRKYKTRPPALVIVDGCNAYDDDADIPF